MRIDDKNIHLFYRPNCPPKGVKANKVVSGNVSMILRLYRFVIVDRWILMMSVTLTRQE